MNSTTFGYQKWRKEESEQRIINALVEMAKTFSDLLNETNLSKPILSERLKSLRKQGKISVVPDVEKRRFRYNLKWDSLEDREQNGVIFSQLSKQTLMEVEEKAGDSSISDERYLEILEYVVQLLISFKLAIYLRAPFEVKREWIANTFGVEFANKMPTIFPKERLERIRNTMTKVDPEKDLLFKGTSPKEIETNVKEYLSTKLQKREMP